MADISRSQPQSVIRPLQWPEIITSRWKLAWLLKWRGLRMRFKAGYHGWSMELPFVLVLFTRFSR